MFDGDGLANVWKVDAEVEVVDYVEKVEDRKGDCAGCRRTKGID